MIGTNKETQIILATKLLPQGTLATNELNNLVSLTIRTGRSDRPHQRIKKALWNKMKLAEIEEISQQVFYRQNITGRTFAQVFPELCDIAKSPDKLLLRLQVEVSALFTISEEHWYSIIRYCLFCYNQYDAPSVVFASPVATQYMDLFIVQPFSKNLTQQERDFQWLINKMISIQIALWLSKPSFLTSSIISQPSGENSEINYRLYINKAIYDALVVYQVETIYQLTDRLMKHYGLEVHHRIHSTMFSILRFRFGLLAWVNTTDLSFGLQDIRLWLDFNRLIKQEPIRKRILAKYLV